ncbi:HPr family phosphocarrier protein [Clostridium sediminicola]|uniref:HPr family phosphocarrier protein n=1 Tax=Clostridium sediminicola TaxID=3114879 RepID=UPI0031F22E8D
MVKKSVKVTNESGLHARPASILVEEAGKFKSNIKIICGEESFNAKSIIIVLTAGIVCGTEIEICADGVDEIEAVNTLVNLVKSGLRE